MFHFKVNEMPMFEFRCVTCLTLVERLVKADVTTVECPNCSGKAEKQLSAPGGFNLVGDGFYKPNASKPVE